MRRMRLVFCGLLEKNHDGFVMELYELLIALLAFNDRHCCAFAPFSASALEGVSASQCSHAVQKAMLASAASFFRVPGSF